MGTITTLSVLIKKFKKRKNITFFFQSIQAFFFEFVKRKNPFSIFRRKKKGISVLLPTQNEESIVRLSILSFLDFADEIIVVDNGSIDNTKEIVRKLEKKYEKVKFFDKPKIQDLYQNRQFALLQSNYRWICRFDSDFVAYTSGTRDIRKLRNYILKLPQGLIPKVISLKYLNLGIDFWHIRLCDFSMKNKIKVIAGPRMSIYEYFPFLTFAKFGEREYVGFQIFLKNIIIKPVYIFHCIIKSKRDFFLRSERANWRKTNDFSKYPTLLSYVKFIIQKKYNTYNIEEALELFSKNVLYKKGYYEKYDSDKYLPYPQLIKEEMKKENIFRLSKYLIN